MEGARERAQFRVAEDRGELGQRQLRLGEVPARGLVTNLLEQPREAGAVILQASDEPGILSTHLHADGQYKELLTVPAGVSENNALFKSGEAYMQMKGTEVFKMAVNTLGRIVDETLEANQMQKSDVTWLVPHQANIRIINATAKKLNMKMDHVVVTVDEHGNTSAASVPLALDVAVRDGRIQRGDTILLEAFGGGFTWGSALVKF